MAALDPLLIGATLALAAIAIGAVAVLPRSARPAAVYAQLVAMVAIYVGFAIARIDQAALIQRGDWSALVVEATTALVFMLAGLAVMSGARAWLLGALILAHGGADFLHLVFPAAHAPAWYAFVCLIFDGVVGVAAIRLLSARVRPA